jgi:excisionase family DNA binding protein
MKVKGWIKGKSFPLLLGHPVKLPEARKGVNGMIRDFVGEVFGVRELAGYLGLSQITIYRLAEKGKVPGRKIGGNGKWKFLRDEIERWLRDERIEGRR